MLRKLLALCSASLACLAVSGTAGAASLTNENLVGTWALDDDQCGQEKSELITFRKTGVVESTRGGRVEAVGFWKLNNDTIQMSVLAPPAVFHEKLKDVEGYHPFNITVVAFDITGESFGGVGLLAEQVRRAKFTRCKT
jgi:hypothetical protein